jgi:hypothetical protein
MWASRRLTTLQASKAWHRDNSTVFRRNLLSWVQQAELVSVSRASCLETESSSIYSVDRQNQPFPLHKKSLLFWKAMFKFRLKIKVKKKKKNSVAWVCVRTYLPSDRRMSTKLMPTFADRGCHVVSVTDPYGRILAFLARSRYFFFQVVPQLYSRGYVDPVLDPLLLIKPGSARNRSRASGSVARNSDH